MPKPYPEEFREDVVRVARNREPGCDGRADRRRLRDPPDDVCTKWLRRADVEDGDQARRQTRGESAELRELRKRNRLLEQENEVLRRAAAYLSQANLPGKGSTRSSASWPPTGIPVAVTCRVLKLARQPYYRWLAAPGHRRRARLQAHRANALFDAHRDDPEFGYRFLADEARDAGQPMAERTAWRICSDNGWWSRVRQEDAAARNASPARRSTTTWCGATSPHRRPNQLWLTDITEHRTGEGKLYLCAIKDVCSNRIVGYSIDSRMKSRLAVARAGQRRRPLRRGDVAGCIVHTDRGSQFRCTEIPARADPPPHGRIDGPGRRPPATTPPWSRFFSLLQKNVLNRRTWATRDELRIAIVTWIERTYHRRRRQAALGRLTPIEYETIMTTPATQAA